MSKKTLVTGGGGFIGSHLVEYLLTKGHRVIVVDNFCTGRRNNLTHVLSSKKVKIINLDISNPGKRLYTICKEIDWVFHLAARADIVPSIVDPLSYHQSNVDGTIHMLEAARAANVSRFIYAASSSCYGVPRMYPTPETAPISPQYPYALTKYIGEQYVLHWGKVYKLPVMSLRLFNVYGPRSRTSGTYGAVFGTFLAQKLAGKPFTVVGDGKQLRDFTYVSDVVRAFVSAAESNVVNQICNIGTGDPQSITTLVSLLKGSVVHIPKRPGEPKKTQADITKARKLLGWKPEISFKQGVKHMLFEINYWKTAPVWTPKTIQKATREWFEYLQ